MARRVFLHAGKHKTGTSSIQHYLADNRDFFALNNFTVIENNNEIFRRKGLSHTVNCNDIAQTIIRPELRTQARLRNPELASITYAEQQQDAERINQRLTAQAGGALIISAEAFSFLRHPSERAIFDLVFEDFDLHTIVFFRERLNWLESWKKQTAKVFARFGRDDDDVESIFDYDPNSWLVNDADIEKFFQPNCRSVFYEAAMEEHRSVLPEFLEMIGLDPSECPASQEHWVNRSQI